LTSAGGVRKREQSTAVKHSGLLYAPRAAITMTFIYEPDPYALKIYQMSENELRMSRLSKVIVGQTDRQTDRRTKKDRHDRNYYHSRFACGNKSTEHNRWTGHL